MLATQAFTYLGNGVGMIYVTDASGTWPQVNYTSPYFYNAYGFSNDDHGKARIMKTVGNDNRVASGTTSAYGFIIITNSAADTVQITVGGVAQTAAPVAMVVGDDDASALAIATAINSFVAASNDCRATAFGAQVVITSNSPGGGMNGFVIAFTPSGASTADTQDLGGGQSPGDRPYRIWIDPSPSAVMNPPNLNNATDITEVCSQRGLDSVAATSNCNVTSNAVLTERTSNIQYLHIDGVT